MTDKNNKIVFFETNVGKNRVIVNKNGVNNLNSNINGSLDKYSEKNSVERIYEFVSNI